MATRFRRVFVTCITYGAIILVTLIAVDLTLIALDLFPPPHNPGDPQLGWRPARATGRMAIGKCIDLDTGLPVIYQRNEDGIRTTVSRADSNRSGDSIRIAITGDSHTDLCSTNETLHSGVLASALRSRGVPAVALSYGVGRYSPLQDYLAFRAVLRPYQPQVFILNLYTGNDFYDMLRIDDRPHLVALDSGFRVAPPVWYALDDPSRRRRSRVLQIARAIGDKTGIRTAIQRFGFLREIAGREGQGGLRNDIAYMRHLVAARDPALGYPDALTAQMLNQQLYFHHFPAGRAESLRRIRHVLRVARNENPGVLLVLSPIPSYLLVGETPVDSALVRVTNRIPVTLADAISNEQALYDALLPLARDEGWLFVDNLRALRANTGDERLFNSFDYHLRPVASEIVGQAQAAILGPVLAGHAP